MVRYGFVANSSSSSYVLAVKDEPFFRVLETLTQSQVKIIGMVVEHKQVLGEFCAVFHDLEEQGVGKLSEVCLPGDIELPDGVEECDWVWDAFYEYKKAVREILEKDQDYFETSLYQG